AVLGSREGTVDHSQRAAIAEDAADTLGVDGQVLDREVDAGAHREHVPAVPAADRDQTTPAIDGSVGANSFGAAAACAGTDVDWHSRPAAVERHQAATGECRI